jgi:hypothetical protein
MSKTETFSNGPPPPGLNSLPETEVVPYGPSAENRRREVIEADILATLSAVVRRPPALSRVRSSHGAADGFEQVLLAQAAPLLRMPTGQLAHTVSGLVLRRQAMCKAAGDGEALSGLAALNLLARMFEHLAIMQSK